MEPNIINVSSDKVKMAWRGFVYEFESGESKFVTANVLHALLRRMPNQLKPFKAAVKKKPEKKEVVEDAVNG